MWSSDRRGALLALGAMGALAGLSACGFTPALGPGAPARAALGQIALPDPTDRNEYELVRRLEERLGRAQAPRWRLEWELAVERRDVGVTATQEITRTRLVGTLRYKLRSVRSGSTVTSGEVSAFDSFSNLGSTVSTASVERDAYRRLMVMLADRLVARLLAEQADWAE